MERITVDKDNLKLLINDIDDLVDYIEELVNWAYDEGYNNGVNKNTASTNKYDLSDITDFDSKACNKECE